MIKYVPDELMKKYSEEVSKFYDVETLTNDFIDREIESLYQEGLRLQEVLAMMERVKGQHTDLMKFYADRNLIMEKIDALQTFCSHRRNLIMKAVQKKLDRQRREREKTQLKKAEISR